MPCIPTSGVMGNAYAHHVPSIPMGRAGGWAGERGRPWIQVGIQVWMGLPADLDEGIGDHVVVPAVPNVGCPALAIEHRGIEMAPKTFEGKATWPPDGLTPTPQSETPDRIAFSWDTLGMLERSLPICGLIPQGQLEILCACMSPWRGTVCFAWRIPTRNVSHQPAPARALTMVCRGCWHHPSPIRIRTRGRQNLMGCT